MQTVDRDFRALQAEIGHLRKDMAEIAETLRETVRDGRRGAIGQVRQTSARIVGNAGQTARTVVHEIEDRPVVSAFAAGAVVAIALGLLLYTRQR